MWIWKTQDVRVRTVLIWLRTGFSGEQWNERSDPIKAGEFVDWLSYYRIIKKD
jgi:hypothetical protein